VFVCSVSNHHKTQMSHNPFRKWTETYEAIDVNSLIDVPGPNLPNSDDSELVVQVQDVSDDESDDSCICDMSSDDEQECYDLSFKYAELKNSYLPNTENYQKNQRQIAREWCAAYNKTNKCQNVSAPPKELVAIYTDLLIQKCHRHSEEFASELNSGKRWPTICRAREWCNAYDQLSKNDQAKAPTPSSEAYCYAKMTSTVITGHAD